MTINIYHSMATIYVDNLINNTPSGSSSSLNLHKKTETLKKYSFSDLHLDFKINFLLEDGSYGIKTNDIAIDTDNEAIKNSLHNIFNTRRGMRYLDPTFGAAFEQFLFEKVSVINARVLAQIIRDHISKYENRILLLNVFAQSIPEEHMYQISIAYKILSSGANFNVKVNLSSNSSQFV